MNTPTKLNLSLTCAPAGEPERARVVRLGAARLQERPDPAGRAAGHRALPRRHRHPSHRKRLLQVCAPRSLVPGNVKSEQWSNAAV